MKQDLASWYKGLVSMSPPDLKLAHNEGNMSLAGAQDRKSPFGDTELEEALLMTELGAGLEQIQNEGPRNDKLEPWGAQNSENPGEEDTTSVGGSDGVAKYFQEYDEKGKLVVRHNWVARLVKDLICRYARKVEHHHRGKMGDNRRSFNIVAMFLAIPLKGVNRDVS